MNVLVSVTLEELKELADNLRPYMADAMNIEVAPWIRDYVVDMEDLYTDLSLERIENRSTGIKTIVVENYRELFLNENDMSKPKTEIPELEPDNELIKPKKEKMIGQNKGRGKSAGLNLKRKERGKETTTQCRPSKKILAKGDPGTGTTTFCKKVACDWAKGIFTAYSIVFFVFLKLVNPGDAIENIIIQQMPVFQGLNISPRELKSI